MYSGSDTCGILSLWVIFEVLIAVSVKRAVILVETQCRLIETYHPLFFYQEVRGGRFLNRYGENRASCFLQNICKFLTQFISWNLNFMKHRGTATCSAACTLFTCNGWMEQFCPIKCTSFSLKWETFCSGNLKLMVLSCNRNLAFQRPHAKTEVHQAVLEHWEWLTALVIGRQL